jgi:RecA/RadA recombinase
MINVALSGALDGGLTSGLTVLAGPSRHFKTSFALLMAGAYMQAHPDAVMLFYDSEFGSPEAYFQSYGIDTSRVLHSPITNVEELKFDLMNQLAEMKREDNVIIVVDSLGNLASKKEVEDAVNEKSVADMTRAKALKGLFRMVTPFLTTKDIPMVAINHTYKEIGLFPKDVVSGGTGIMYSSDNIWIIGRRQNKDATGIKGYHFIINVEKSRFVKEKSQIPISVTYDGGVETFSGLLEVACAGGFIAKPTKGFYQLVDTESGELVGNKMRESQLWANPEFWKPIIDNPKFAEFVRNQYTLGYKSMIEDFDLGLDSEGEQ